MNSIMKTLNNVHVTIQRAIFANHWADNWWICNCSGMCNYLYAHQLFSGLTKMAGGQETKIQQMPKQSLINYVNRKII